MFVQLSAVPYSKQCGFFKNWRRCLDWFRILLLSVRLPFFHNKTALLCHPLCEEMAMAEVTRFLIA